MTAKTDQPINLKVTITEPDGRFYDIGYRLTDDNVLMIDKLGIAVLLIPAQLKADGVLVYDNRIFPMSDPDKSHYIRYIEVRALT